MGAYSPLLATYGVRVDQLLETVQDFVRYHDKLNKKLQKLRHRCQLTTRDTKKYHEKEKYSKITSDDYDEKSKLYGVVVLLHAERDLALAEILKLRARQRGKLKKSERKVIGTRLKRAMQTSEKLATLTQNEPQWTTRIQYLIYDKLTHAEYLTHGKQQRRKDSEKISGELALSFAALKFLGKSSVITEDVVEFLYAKYEYTLKQHADRAFSSTELHNFVVEKVEQAHQKGDEIVKLLMENGYRPQKQVSEAATSFKEIQWRAFTTKVYDPQVEELIAESQSLTVKGVPDYDTKLLKWQQALEKQESRIASQDEDEDDENDNQENDQILLAYIRYNALFTSVLRDNYLFGQLWQQWTKLGTAMASRLTKCKEIERIVKNLQKYLQDIMELPGVYQDDELLEQLEMSKLCFQLFYSSGCLGSLYQLKGRYLESLALHVDAHHKLEERLLESGKFQDILIPHEVLSYKKIESLQQLIKAGWKSVVSLAEYERHLKAQGQTLYQPTLIEKLDTGRIVPSDVSLSNIFPLRPKLRPVPSKPTLFDLAFNYVDYSGGSSGSDSSLTIQKPEDVSPKKTGGDNNSGKNKKRGFLGLFGR